MEEVTEMSLPPESWPPGFAASLEMSKDIIDRRFVLIDNSSSMLKEGGKRIVKGSQGVTMVYCSRWEEVSTAVTTMARTANMFKCQTDIRLLNHGKHTPPPVVIGKTEDITGKNALAVEMLLASPPSGQTPLCREIRNICEQLRKNMNHHRPTTTVTEGNGVKQSLVIIVTDGEASDGSLVAALRPLESLPVRVLVRMCTSESNVLRYWSDIQADLDMDIVVLDDWEVEAEGVARHNPWLTYALVLHELREFGVGLSSVGSSSSTSSSSSSSSSSSDIGLLLEGISERSMTLSEIRTIIHAILLPPPQSVPATPPTSSSTSPSASVSTRTKARPQAFTLPDPNTCPWGVFVSAVDRLQKEMGTEVYCPIRRVLRPWIDLEALAKYTVDPLQHLLTHPVNQSLLGAIFAFYVHQPDTLRPATTLTSTSTLSINPTVIGLAAQGQGLAQFTWGARVRHHRRSLLAVDRLWQMCVDFGMVPSLVNTHRLGKTLQEIGVTTGTVTGTEINAGGAGGGPQATVSYRQWLAVFISIADSGFPLLPSPAHRMARLMHCMEMTGHLHRVFGDNPPGFALEGLGLEQGVTGVGTTPARNALHTSLHPPVDIVISTQSQLPSPIMAGYTTPSSSIQYMGVPTTSRSSRHSPPKVDTIRPISTTMSGTTTTPGGTTTALTVSVGRCTPKFPPSPPSASQAVRVPYPSPGIPTPAYYTQHMTASHGSGSGRNPHRSIPKSPSSSLALVCTPPPVAVPALMQLLNERDVTKLELDQCLVLLDEAYMRIGQLEGLLSDAEEAVAPWKRKCKGLKDAAAVVERQRATTAEEMQGLTRKLAGMEHQLGVAVDEGNKARRQVADFAHQLADAHNSSQDALSAWNLERASLQVLIQRGDEEMQSLRYGQTMDKQALTWLHAERDKWTALNQGLTARIDELEADKVSQQEAVQTCHTRLNHLETLTTRQQADWQQSVSERDEALAQAQGLRHQLAEALKEGQESVRQWQQLQHHVASLKVDELIAAKNAAEVKALEMDMKSRVDAADLQDLRHQLQALVLDKITQDHALHGATQASTIAQEESTTLRRHLATYKDTAERQEKEIRDMTSQHKQEVTMLRKESAEIKLALETELAGLRAGKLQHDHEVALLRRQLEDDRRFLETRVGGLERELVDARSQAQTNELARVEVQQGLERRIQALTLESTGYREDASALRRQVDTLTASGQDTAQALSGATAEGARMAQQLVEARRAQREAGVEAQTKLAHAQDALLVSEEKVHSLTAALASADKHLARVTLTGQTDAATLVTIKEQLMECQGKLQAMERREATLEASTKRDAGMLLALQTDLKEANSVKVRLEGLVVQWERDHQRCVDELTTTKRTLETAMTERDALARQLKEKETQLVQECEASQSHRRHGLEAQAREETALRKVRELERDVQVGTEEITSLRASLFSQTSDIDALRHSLTTNEASLARTQQALVEVQRTAGEQAIALTTAQGQRQEDVEQIATLRRQLSEASSGRAVAEASDAVLRQRQNELQASLQALASEKDTAWKQKEQELEALRSELTIARAEQAALVAEKAAYQRQAQVEQQSGVEEQTARQRHLEGLTKETETWRERAGQMEKDKDAMRVALADLQQQLEKMAADKATSEARMQQQLSLQTVDREGLEARLSHQVSLIRAEKDQLETTSQQQLTTLLTEKTALETRLKALEEGYLLVRQQAQTRSQSEASAQEQLTTLLAEKTALEARLRSLEEGYLQARAKESSPSHSAITPVMVAEGEFLRHVTARVQAWRQEGDGSGSGLGSAPGSGTGARLLLDKDRLLLPSYGWLEKDTVMPHTPYRTPN